MEGNVGNVVSQYRSKQWHVEGQIAVLASPRLGGFFWRFCELGASAAGALRGPVR